MNQQQLNKTDAGDAKQSTVPQGSDEAAAAMRDGEAAVGGINAALAAAELEAQRAKEEEQRKEREAEKRLAQRQAEREKIRQHCTCCC